MISIIKISTTLNDFKYSHAIYFLTRRRSNKANQETEFLLYNSIFGISLKLTTIASNLAEKKKLGWKFGIHSFYKGKYLFLFLS